MSADVKKLLHNKVCGQEVILDHIFFEGHEDAVRILSMMTGIILEQIPEPFKEGRHVWLQGMVVDNWSAIYPIYHRIEIHFRRLDIEDQDSPIHPGHLHHLGYRVKSLEALKTVKDGYWAAGYEIFEPSVVRTEIDGVVERFYVRVEKQTIEYLFHPGKTADFICG